MKNITRNAARIAALALCTLAIGSATLPAQDTPPPPPQQDGAAPAVA